MIRAGRRRRPFLASTSASSPRRRKRTRTFAAAEEPALAASTSQGQQASIARQRALARSYFRRGTSAIEAIRTNGFAALAPERDDALVRLLHSFEHENARFLEVIQGEPRATLDRCRWLATGTVVLLAVAFAALGHLLFSRSERRARSRREWERERRELQREFSEALQVTQSESEAYGLISAISSVGSPAAP